MTNERCLDKCKYIKDSKCSLYGGITLTVADFPDPFGEGDTAYWCKCNDCKEKELSCSIDDKVREVYAFYEAYKHETDILFAELEDLITRRENIYKEEE